MAGARSVNHDLHRLDEQAMEFLSYVVCPPQLVGIAGDEKVGDQLSFLDLRQRARCRMAAATASVLSGRQFSVLS